MYKVVWAGLEKTYGPATCRLKIQKEWGGKKKERQSYNKTLNDIDKSSETGEYLARGYDVRIKQALGKYVTVTEWLTELGWEGRRNGDLQQTETATVTRTWQDKRSNEENNSSALVLWNFVHFLTILCKITEWNHQTLHDVLAHSW